MATTKAALPATSMLHTSGETYHYVDAYKSSFIDSNNTITTLELSKAFFSAGPKWVEVLFHIRNKIVSVFGLKTSNVTNNRQALLNAFKCEPGERLGLFKVYAKTDKEVVLGEDDAHLNFRVSLFMEPLAKDGIQKKEITVSTVVKYNNWFGRLYFLPVRPFHRLIAPTLLKGMIKELEKG